MGTVAERGDRAERVARPQTRFRAAYWSILGGHSPRCAPRDRATAKSFLRRIEHAIEVGGWTRNEWRNLHKLYEKWSARATGRDPRFDEVGTRPGRLDRGIEAWLNVRRSHFSTAEHVRVAQPLRLVDAADPRSRPSPATLKSRAWKKAQRQKSEDRG